jgi:signal transduction histidine kinase
VFVLGGKLVLALVYSQLYPQQRVAEPPSYLSFGAGLLLVAAVALIAFHVADVLATRRSERKAAEVIRAQAAAAERERLARPIHDGVLQVLALMERYGPDLGEQGAKLATLAGEQNAALRTLMAGEAPAADGATADLRVLVTSLASATVDVAVSADPIELPAARARELFAAIVAAVDNAHRHGGPEAHTWILVEDEPGEIRVSVRDDGPGIPEGRLAEAAGSGRLGVAQSMTGRVRDLGGTTEITSGPGDGTEVEFRVPR